VIGGTGSTTSAIAAVGAGLVALTVAMRCSPRRGAQDVRRRLSPPRTGSARTVATRRFTARSLAAWSATALAASLVDIVLGVGIAVLAGAWVLGQPRRATRRHRREVDAALPEVLDLFVVCIEAGHLPLDAMRVLHPVLPRVVGTAFAEVVARVDRGLRFGEALAALPERLGPSTMTLVDALVQTDRAGLAYGPAVERLADDARHHRRRLAEAAARELPVRLAFPLVVCTLPSFVLVAIVPLLVGALSSVRVG
jgi:tight adherence protein C